MSILPAIREGVDNIRITNRLKGLVDISKLTSVGGLDRTLDVILSKTISGDIVDGGFSKLDKAVEHVMDNKGVFDTIMSFVPGDRDGFAFDLVSPFMPLVPLKNYHSESVFDHNIISVIREQAFLETLLELEEEKIHILFDKGVLILGELTHLFGQKVGKLSTVKSGIANMLDNVIPHIEKIDVLGVFSELIPFLSREVSLLESIMGIVQQKTIEYVGIKPSRKETLGLLQFVSKIAPIRPDVQIFQCDTAQCKLQWFEEAGFNGLLDVVGSRVNLKEIFLHHVPLQEAAGFLVHAVEGMPKEFVPHLEYISGGVLDPVSIISFVATAASQVPRRLTEGISRKEAIAHLVRSEGIGIQTLKNLVDGFEIIDIPELGSVVAMEGGFLTDRLDSVLTGELLSGGLNFQIFGEENGFSYTGDSDKVGVLSLESFPGGKPMFEGLLESSSALLFCFDTVKDVLGLGEHFDEEGFLEMAIGLISDSKLSILSEILSADP